MKIQRICPLMYSLVLLALFAACQTVGPSQSQIINTPTDKIEITPIKPATDTSQPIVTPTDTPSPTATPTIPPPSIDGHVTAAGSGDPLVEARVELRTGQNLDELVAYTSTDQDGYYRFDDLPEGVYYALAFADGYARELYQQETALQEANVLNYDGKPLAGIDFVLNEGGSISGTLTVGGEQPAANVVVSAVEAKYAWADAFMYRAVSDENGFYQILHLPLGEYVVVIEEPGYATEFYDSTYYLSLAIAVDVRPPEDTAGIDIQLEPEGKISGVVIDDETGEPVINTKVHLNPKGPPGAYTWGIVVETKDSNTFSIGRLPPARYLLSAR
ncbi:MAG: carboxypeptidase-like regulatory domain-containing protein, partial [Anaerolineales bacterium]